MDVMDLTLSSSKMEGVTEEQVVTDEQVVTEDTSSSPSPQQADNDVFPFFRLPRELRDNIYDLAHGPEAKFTVQNAHRKRWDDAPPEPATIFHPTSVLSAPEPSAFTSLSEVLGTHRADTRPTLHATVKSRASTNLLLTNKTCMNEYEPRAKLSMTLVLKDHEQYSFQRFILPPQVHQVKHAEFHLIFFCHPCPMLAHLGPKTCQAALESAAHLNWIKSALLQLPALKTLTIDALLCYQGWTPEQKDKLDCESILEEKIKSYYKLEKLTRFTLAKYDFNARPDLEGERVVMLKWTPQGGQVKVVEKEEEKKEDAEGDEEMKTSTVMVTVEEADEVEGGDDAADNDGNQASGEDEDDSGTEGMDVDEDDSETEIMDVDEDDANDAGDEDDDEDALYSVSL